MNAEQLPPIDSEHMPHDPHYLRHPAGRVTDLTRRFGARMVVAAGEARHILQIRRQYDNPNSNEFVAEIIDGESTMELGRLDGERALVAGEAPFKPEELRQDDDVPEEQKSHRWAIIASVAGGVVATATAITVFEINRHRKK